MHGGSAVAGDCQVRLRGGGICTEVHLPAVVHLEGLGLAAANDVYALVAGLVLARLQRGPILAELACSSTCDLGRPRVD